MEAPTKSILKTRVFCEWHCLDNGRTAVLAVLLVQGYVLGF